MHDQKKSLIGSLLQYIGLVFCFFVFPFFVFNSSLASLLDLRLENHRQQVYQELSDRLKMLMPFNDERRYYHLMLQKVFNIALEQPDPFKYLEQAIARLKQNHPGRFEFIVWNNSGAVVDKLTDEKRFHFVMRRLYQVFRGIADHLGSSDSETIRNLKIVKSNLNLIRHFLGRVFLPETLLEPYLDNGKDTIILADYGQHRPYFWYHTDKKLTMLCFLSWDAVTDNRGIKSIIRSVNRNDDRVCVGFASLHELARPYLCRNHHIANEVILALAKYENSSEQAMETENAQIVVQMLNLHTRIFALRLKDHKIYSPEVMRRGIVTRAVLVYLLLGLLIYFNFKIRRAFFSIRWKLLLLFLYANVAPLIVLGAIAYDYLENRKISLRNEVQLESARLLREIDSRFSTQSEQFAQRLNRMVDNINAENGARALSAAKIEQIRKKILEFKPSEAFLIDRNGKTKFSFGSDGGSINHSTTYIKNLADALLKYHRRIIVKAEKSDVLSKIVDPQESEFIRNSIRDGHKIWRTSIGDTMKMSYWRAFGDSSAYVNNYFLLLMWDEEVFQKLFLDQYFRKMARKNLLAGTYAKTVNSQQVVPDPGLESHALTSFLKSAANSGSNIFGNLQLAGKTYLATGWRGKNMNSTCFAVVSSTSEIEAEIADITRRMLSGAALSIILTIIIALAVARQFLEPVRALSTAAIAVNRHDYRHRIAIPDKDEFGHLAEVMNRMIEGLGELEIAKVVQESLLPEQQPDFKPFDIYGESVAMTTLAGDYFDFIEVSKEKLGIIIGDVAGHGISAALIMAMAKAGVRMASTEETVDGVKFVDELHKIIYSLKSGQLKSMMTFQYLLLDRTSATIQLTNAGHCYPLLVDSKLQHARYIEMTGMPLGSVKSPCYKSISLQLTAGQALILYTDGIAEAQTDSGQVMGYDGFAALALRSYSQSAETHYRRIYQECLDWSGNNSGDDITMIVINFPEK